MDFFFNLPKAAGGYEDILLVVDRESKMVKLILCIKESPWRRQLYIKYVYCNYGLLVLIVSNQDTRFDFDFWKIL
jgi:hypothetical protein